jgi:hypothetical protein
MRDDQSQDLKQWADMNHEERHGFLDMIEWVMSDASGDDVSASTWREMERIDAYSQRVLERIGPSERSLLEQSDLLDEDLTERFYEHCNRAFQVGMNEAACARSWRARPP